jgi:iron(III) transport system substrate-binding protein
MKRRLFVMSFMLMASAVAFCATGWAETAKKGQNPAPAKAAASAKAAQGKTLQAAHDKIVAAAKQEGKLEWWDTTDPEASRGLITDFNKVYPFIKVNHLEVSTDEAAQRMKLETAAGKCSVDIFKCSGSDQAGLEAASGMLMKWDPNADGFNVSKDAIDDNQKAFCNETRLYVIGYNTNLVKPQDAPKSWKDLLDPKWKGKVVTKMKPNAFTYFLPLWGEEKTLQYVKDFAKNKPPLEKSGSTVLQLVVAGEHPVGIVYYHQVLEMRKQGAPIAYVMAEPIPMSTSSLVIAGHAPHPNAAKLWTGWELSRAGQESRWRHYWSSVPFPEVAAKEFLADIKGKQISLLGDADEAKYDTNSLLEKYYKILKQ